MDEMEMRVLQEHTRALDENTQAIRTFTRLLSEMMTGSTVTNPSGEIIPVTRVLSRLEEIEANLNVDARRFSNDVSSLADIASKNRCSVEMFCDSASRMRY